MLYLFICMLLLLSVLFLPSRIKENKKKCINKIHTITIHSKKAKCFILAYDDKPFFFHFFVQKKGGVKQQGFTLILNSENKLVLFVRLFRKKSIHSMYSTMQELKRVTQEIGIADFPLNTFSAQAICYQNLQIYSNQLKEMKIFMRFIDSKLRNQGIYILDKNSFRKLGIVRVCLVSEREHYKIDVYRSYNT